jgi:redox-sensitive bicupin YhaK (pirin superfamily)
MTAGSGIVHSEMPTPQILRDGGRVHGFQLWVNLPKAAKWNRPRYQDLTAENMPTVDLDAGSAVIIAGEAFGTRGAADTFLPINYYHLRIKPEEQIDLEVDPGHLAFVYAFEGGGTIGATGTPFNAGEAAVFDFGEGRIPLRSSATGLQVLVGSAEPLQEPVARYGPFVMNTRQEILQAFEDFHAGRMGQIEPERN